MDPTKQISQQIEAANRAARKRIGMKSEESFVQRVPNCFSADELSLLKATTDEHSNPSDVSVRGKVSHSQTARRSRQLWLPPDEFKWVYERMLKIARRVNECYHYQIDRVDDKIQIAYYDESEQGFFTWHMDWGSDAQQRKISISIPLNDPAEYEGGDLEFNVNGIPAAVPQEQGVAISFPSYILHRVTPVTRGRRYSMVAWIHGPPFR